MAGNRRGQWLLAVCCTPTRANRDTNRNDPGDGHSNTQTQWSNADPRSHDRGNTDTTHVTRDANVYAASHDTNTHGQSDAHPNACSPAYTATAILDWGSA